jgi:AAA+ superfamily predicted ATPase
VDLGEGLSLSLASLKDKALELAKRLSHGSAETAHVLSVALVELGEADKAMFQPQVEQLLGLTQKKQNQSLITISSEAEKAAKRLVSSGYSKSVFEEFLDLGSPEAITAPSTSDLAQLDTEKDETETSVPTVITERSLEEVLAELDSLIGLDDVKKQVRSVMATHLVNKKRVETGLKAVANSLHLVFSGEPGTGKTTVARLVSEIYRAQGILRVGHLVEVGRSDLIAEYVGQTAPKVKKAINQALGGVLFIDEAYSLAQDTQQGYGAEAIATLLQLMENHRGDLSVIVAGYKDEMDYFVASNPGLRSRFQTYIDFPKYNAKELVEIFSRMCVSNQIELTPTVRESVLKHFENNETSGVAGNARYARKLFEVAFTELSGRAIADGIIEDYEISAFVESDIPQYITQATKTKNKLGF